MFNWYRRWRRQRLLRQCDCAEKAWQEAWSSLPVLQKLDGAEAQRLRELAALFLAEKSLEPEQELTLSQQMSQLLALQACLPVLRLGLDWLEGWVSVVLYPDAFISDHDETDEAGVVHRVREARSGESWSRGPLILSWRDVVAGTRLDGYNVVIHEIAHKLDGLDGTLNGLPPLHRGMSYAAWHDTFAAAYADLERRAAAGHHLPVDPYALKSPAEFFAVMSETYFELPEHLAREYPALFEQLQQFYRPDIQSASR